MLVVTSGVAGQQAQASLFSAVSSGQYFGATYTDSAGPLTFVFFTSEPIRLDVIIGNRGPERGALTFSEPTPTGMFAVDGTRDGAPFSVDLTFDGGRWEGRLGVDVAPFDPSQPTRLDAGDQVRWRAVVARPLPPGRYRVRIRSNAVDGDGHPVPAHIASHEFEVRIATDAARAEILRREALRQYTAGGPADLAEADKVISELLQVHPTSYEAFLIRGHVARARGQEAQAQVSYARAVAILSRDQDSLLVRYQSASERQRRLTSVNGLLAR
jgi:hypothetical protein